MSDHTPQGAAPDTGAAPRTRRGIKIALAVSLALNVLILGIVGGAVLGRGGPEDVPPLRTLGLGPFALALDRDGREAVRNRLEGRVDDLRGDRREIGRSLRALQTALRADPFDRELAEEALLASRRSAIALQARGHGALLDELDEMPLAAREQIADRLTRIVRRGGGGAERGRPEGSPRGDADGGY